MVSIANGQGGYLAKQGDLQAIALMLNQQLNPKGAQINLKRDADCLQILLTTRQGVEQKLLIVLMCQQLRKLQPAGFTTVKIYQPLPGKTTAALIYKSDILSPSSKATSIDTKQELKRYSVAQFLAQVDNVNDLRALKNHPFCTNQCPQCGYQFDQTHPLPEYWDCHQCDWVDDLTHLVSQTNDHKLLPQTTKAEIKRLGNYLVEADLVTEDQIKVALSDQKLTGMRLGDALVKRGWINRETVEYLMKKVILPERSASQDTSCLELSRNLVKTLLTQLPDDQRADSFQVLKAGAAQISDMAESKRTQPPIEKSSNDRPTLVVSEEDLAKYLD